MAIGRKISKALQGFFEKPVPLEDKLTLEKAGLAAPSSIPPQATSFTGEVKTYGDALKAVGGNAEELGTQYGLYGLTGYMHARLHPNSPLPPKARYDNSENFRLKFSKYLTEYQETGKASNLIVQQGLDLLRKKYPASDYTMSTRIPSKGMVEGNGARFTYDILFTNLHSGKTDAFMLTNQDHLTAAQLFAMSDAGQEYGGMNKVGFFNPLNPTNPIGTQRALTAKQIQNRFSRSHTPERVADFEYAPLFNNTPPTHTKGGWDLSKGEYYVLDFETFGRTGKPGVGGYGLAHYGWNTEKNGFARMDEEARFYYPTKADKKGKEYAEALEVNHLSNENIERLRNGADYSLFWNEKERKRLLEKIGNKPLIGYNAASFDFNVLLGRSVGFDVEKPGWFDLLHLAEAQRGKAKGRNTLDALYKDVNKITMEEAGLEHHNPLSDVIGTGDTWAALYGMSNRMGAGVRYLTSNPSFFTVSSSGMGKGAYMEEIQNKKGAWGKMKDEDIRKISDMLGMSYEDAANFTAEDFDEKDLAEEVKMIEELKRKNDKLQSGWGTPLNTQRGAEISRQTTGSRGVNTSDKHTYVKPSSSRVQFTEEVSDVLWDKLERGEAVKAESLWNPFRGKNAFDIAKAQNEGAGFRRLFYNTIGFEPGEGTINQWAYGVQQQQLAAQKASLGSSPNLPALYDPTLASLPSQLASVKRADQQAYYDKLLSLSPDMAAREERADAAGVARSAWGAVQGNAIAGRARASVTAGAEQGWRRQQQEDYYKFLTSEGLQEEAARLDKEDKWKYRNGGWRDVKAGSGYDTSGFRQGGIFGNITDRFLSDQKARISPEAQWAEQYKALSKFTKGIQEATTAVTTMTRAWVGTRNAKESAMEQIAGAGSHLIGQIPGISMWEPAWKYGNEGMRQFFRANTLNSWQNKTSIWGNVVKGATSGATSGAMVGGGVPGAVIGGVLGGAAGGVQTAMGLSANKSEIKGNEISGVVNLWAMWANLVFAPLKVAANGLRTSFKMLTKQFIQGMNDFASIGLPLTSLTGQAYPGYQYSTLADRLFHQSAGTNASGYAQMENTSQALYSLGQVNTQHLISSALLGQFSEAYAADGNTEEHYINMMNSIAAQVKGAGSQKERARLMYLAGNIDSSMPSKIQQMLNLGVSDYGSLMDGRFTKSRGMFFRAIDKGERNQFDLNNYEWGAAQEQFRNSRMRIVNVLWNNWGKTLVNAGNEVLDMFARGDWKGGVDKALETIKNLWGKLKNAFEEHGGMEGLKKIGNWFKDVLEAILPHILRWGAKLVELSGDIMLRLTRTIEEPLARLITDLGNIRITPEWENGGISFNFRRQKANSWDAGMEVKGADYGDKHFTKAFYSFMSGANAKDLLDRAAHAGVAGDALKMAAFLGSATQGVGETYIDREGNRGWKLNAEKYFGSAYVDTMKQKGWVNSEGYFTNMYDLNKAIGTFYSAFDPNDPMNYNTVTPNSYAAAAGAVNSSILDTVREIQGILEEMTGMAANELRTMADKADKKIELEMRLKATDSTGNTSEAKSNGGVALTQFQITPRVNGALSLQQVKGTA